MMQCLSSDLLKVSVFSNNFKRSGNPSKIYYTEIKK